MEEVQVIDCPPTPEILLPSATPPSTSALLDMLDSSSSAEELDNCSGDAGDDAAESGRSSPPPKCAICLGKCRQKCYTDSCRHQFCYRCLLEWSKIKAECPLCKQAFRSIIYTRKTYGHYQEHKISIAPPASPPNYPGQGSGSAGGGAARTVPQVYHRLDFTLSQSPRFTYSATLHVQPSQSERLRQLFLHQSGDVQRFSREFPDDSIPSRQNGPEWRRYIYHRRLHARPLADISGRMRECSASFYRENPAQIHRLMPWINRELVALCRNNPAQVSLIMEDFPNLLMSHDITSPAFRERVSYWGRVRTAHFIHELLNFARSPYDIIGYDRSVQYDPYYNNNVVVLSSSSSSSSGSGLSGSEGEDDVVPILEPTPGTSGTVNSVGGPGGSTRRGRTQFTIETRSSDQTVIMTGSFGGAGVSGIVSVSTSGSQHNNGAGTSTSGYPDMSRMQPLTSMVPQPQPPPPVNRLLEDGDNISLSSSDSDDCRIVGALKPPHLRTPEMVSLESESDSDVVFVNDDANTARNQAMESSNVLLEQLFPETLLNDELAKLEEDHAFASEYNNGASTSSGGGSASGGGMKKYYARPRLNRYAEGIGFKSIYEASESDKSQGEPSVKSDSDSSSHDEVKFNIRGQAPVVSRKRKAVKRRQASSTGTSSSDSSEESSTSDSESSSRSSSGCSSSSSSNSDSDSDCSSEKVTLKKRSRRSTVRSSRKTSAKRRQKESKPKRSKAKKRKTSSSKKRSSSRKRQKLQTPKQPAKSSSESGKGTSASCTSGPSTETIPTMMVANPAACSSNDRKRKLKSAIIKLNPVARQLHLAVSKRRRKTPVCSSELITSTDFSSEENKPELNEPPPPAAQQRESSDSSSSDTDTSDSEEGRCTIASLIRAAKADDPVTTEMKQQQNTSSSSSCSSSSVNSSLTEQSSQMGGGAPVENDDDDEAEEEEEEDDDDDDDEEEEVDEHNQSPSPSVSRAGEEVAQVIAVGAEVEL
ncbi:E3 ubiquitin-protein ligase Topors [Aedes albopictus]|uniref:RING-type E3 ubiquitin transferase n=1 Tax=Aedes albopictus TaxID=7160 RepID=A0ABM1XUH8_AEDAL|nr:E3 ubiquitin-protein ligase Topors [Aedes albopictus]KXJ84531.1 hypothetical protein RP20_CCG027144 [Aedes albopictus]